MKIVIIIQYLFNCTRAPGILGDSEYDEFGRFYRSDADNANQVAIIDFILGHRCPIAFDKKRLFCG